MADNIDVDPGTGAAKVPVRTIDRAGVETQVVIVDKSGGATANVGLTGSKTMTTAAPTDVGASEVVAANATRKSVLIVNNSSGVVYVGTSTVASTNGVPLAAGQALTDTTSTDAWFARCAAGVTGDLRIIEVA